MGMGGTKGHQGRGHLSNHLRRRQDKPNTHPRQRGQVQGRVRMVQCGERRGSGDARGRGSHHGFQQKSGAD